MDGITHELGCPVPGELLPAPSDVEAAASRVDANAAQAIAAHVLVL